MAPTATTWRLQKGHHYWFCYIAELHSALAGKVGEEHHVYGATIIEVDDNICYVRSVNATADGHSLI